MKNIIVVTDKKNKQYGRELIHILSGIDEIKASLYDILQYENNEHQITANNYIIFFEKNKISKSYLNYIDNKYKKFGVIWGYSNTVALLYTDKVKYSNKIGSSLVEEINLSKIDTNKIGKNKIYSYLKISSAPWWTYILPPIGFGIDIAALEDRRNQIIHLQKILLIRSFASSGLIDYLKLNKDE